MAVKKGGLGRGLESLFEDAARDVRALPGILRVTRYTPEEQEVPL